MVLIFVAARGRAEGLMITNGEILCYVGLFCRFLLTTLLFFLWLGVPVSLVTYATYLPSGRLVLVAHEVSDDAYVYFSWPCESSDSTFHSLSLISSRRWC